MGGINQGAHNLSRLFRLGSWLFETMMDPSLAVDCGCAEVCASQVGDKDEITL
jgi:hypothetical protein